MAWSFTPGSERVLAAAAAWRSCDDRDELGAPELLLGLLAEAECRAAGIRIEQGGLRHRDHLTGGLTHGRVERRPHSVDVGRHAVLE